jgi:rhodanese-related sulfurtransferase
MPCVLRLLLLLAVLAVPAALAGCGTEDVRTVTAREISADVAAGRVLLVDVREDDEWAAGRAPEAVHVPLGEVAERLEELDRVRDDRPIAFVCRTGRRSAEAARTAVEGGLDDVLHVEGGMGAWVRAGLPLEPPDGRVA